jgi:hypothetical protein
LEILSYSALFMGIEYVNNGKHQRKYRIREDKIIQVLPYTSGTYCQDCSQGNERELHGLILKLLP